MGTGSVNIVGTSILPLCVLSRIGRHDRRLHRLGNRLTIVSDHCVLRVFAHDMSLNDNTFPSNEACFSPNRSPIFTSKLDDI